MRCGATSQVVTIPTALKVDGTYLIFSEVSYLYTPTIGYVMAPIRREPRRRVLHQAASVVLRALQHRALSDELAQTKSRFANEKGRAQSAAFSLMCSGMDSPGRHALREIAQPAARRLSADDLPERRSATIS